MPAGLTNVFDPVTACKEVAAAVLADGYATAEGALDSSGSQTKRFGARLAKSTVAQDLVMHPMPLAVADATNDD